MNKRAKVLTIVLILIMISLIIKMSFDGKSEFVFDGYGVKVNKISDESIDKILDHTSKDKFEEGYYQFQEPSTIETSISKEKMTRILNLIDIEKDYNATIIRGYEIDEFITIRYHIPNVENNSIEDIINMYEEILINSGYTQENDFYIKDNIEINFQNKWDCIILILKGL
jgi:hypothetical protein